jgi:hypothetical protein
VLITLKEIVAVLEVVGVVPPPPPPQAGRVRKRDEIIVAFKIWFIRDISNLLFRQ